MKQSIRYIEFNYDERGRGGNIVILRGMELREYTLILWDKYNSHEVGLWKGHKRIF